MENWIKNKKLVIRNLISFNCDLIKWDRKGNLPLKSGGTTDIYINLRNARRNPDALEYISGLYITPLKNLGAQSFIEVPDSVSCFAPLISINLKIPYVTIRDQSKEGRLFSKMIGEFKGTIVPIIDDVITNGESKIVPLTTAKEKTGKVQTIIVLVDRQQGWEDNLKRNNFIYKDVCAGMTLTDVRSYLKEIGEL